MIPLSLEAPAKINLYLHVTGRRADGYHLLDSIVAFTAVHDQLDITPSPMLTLSVTGPFSAELYEQQENNLVMQAAGMLRLRMGSSKGAHIALVKHIPIGAGLGGGSSDAAAALRGLRKFWHLDCDDAVLRQLALKLGSDVPMCIAPQTAWVRGVGERITPVSLQASAWAVLVNPGQPLLTARVFGAFGHDFCAPGNAPSAIASFSELMTAIEDKRNDLQPIAISMMPVIEDILTALHNTSGCALARMSGSGPTCFGLYDNEAAAIQAAQQLSHLHPSWWCTATRLITPGQAK